MSIAYIQLIRTYFAAYGANANNNLIGHKMIEGYDFWLILLSACVSSIALYFSCRFVSHLYNSTLARRNNLLLIYSITIGCVLFFLNNLNWVAIKPILSDSPISYPMILGSLLAAIFATFTVFSNASEKVLRFNTLINRSFIVAVASYVMFYLSFASRHADTAITINVKNLSFSLVAATVISAMIIAFYFRMKLASAKLSTATKLITSFISGSLIVALYAVFSTTLTLDYQTTQNASYIVNDRETTAIIISLIIISLFALTLIAPNYFEKIKTRLLGANIEDNILEGNNEKDELTQLPNRRGFDAELNASIVRSSRMGKTIALAFIDLDHFKPVNDSFGHQVGDAVLVAIAQRLTKTVRACDFVARLGGDEFVAIIQNITLDEDITPIIERMVECVKASFNVKNHSIDISCSIGVAVYPGDGDVDKLMVCADAAMYKAKENGRNQFKFFDAQIEQASESMITMQRDLRLALVNNQFELLYQPKVDCETQKPLGAEALIRWAHPTKGIILPNDFLKAAERFGLISSINSWVLDEACQTIARAKKLDIDLNISINLALQQFRNPNLVVEIQTALRRHHVAPSSLIFEIKETTAIKNEHQFKSLLEDFKKAQLKVSLDDFGSHHFSLCYLQNLKIDELKLDRVFIAEITDNKASHALVDAVIRMAHALKFNVVAEGVETEAQRLALARMGCNHMQGYLFSKPITEKKLTKLFKQLNHNFEITGQYTVADYQL